MVMRMTARLNMGIGPSTDGKVIFLYDEIRPSVVCSSLQVYDVELQAGEVVVCDALVGDTVRWEGIGPLVATMRAYVADAENRLSAIQRNSGGKPARSFEARKAAKNQQK
jgi:hypothetical protein